MRFRLMATYRGVPYEAAVGPAGADVVLFAACPPPEELGFEPAPGHWRKRVVRAEVDALWESRPVGVFRGESCLVLDDAGDRLHIAYLGTDAGRAAQLGYWQVDRGVFELLAPRDEVSGLTEERVERPLRWGSIAPDTGPVPAYPYGTAPWPVLPPPVTGPLPAMPPPVTGPLLVAAPPEPASAQRAPGSPAATAGPGRGRAARRQRASIRRIFCELADLAAIPRHAYSLEAEADGAMCLLRTGHGYEVFVAAEGARHEARAFDDEEAAYFYLFGVLAAEAVRSGGLAPR